MTMDEYAARIVLLLPQTNESKESQGAQDGEEQVSVDPNASQGDTIIAAAEDVTRQPSEEIVEAKSTGDGKTDLVPAASTSKPITAVSLLLHRYSKWINAMQIGFTVKDILQDIRDGVLLVRSRDMMCLKLLTTFSADLKLLALCCFSPVC